MVLIAQLATASGTRTPLTQVANQVFLHLVEELQSAGLGQKVIADMFGMALRTYHERVRRLSESATDRGQTLWEAVYGEIQLKGHATRGEVLMRFRHDDPLMVRSVLKDLVDSGMVYRTGKGNATSFRARRESEAAPSGQSDEGTLHLLWVLIHRMSPVALADVQAAANFEDEEFDRSLAKLEEDGRVRREQIEGAELLVSDFFMVPFGSEVGWEAALFDHYHAIVSAIVAKLQGMTTSTKNDLTGGSTYTFDVWDGHPMADEVLSLLASTRESASELRDRVDRYNARTPAPRGEQTRVTFYAGQLVPVGSVIARKKPST